MYQLISATPSPYARKVRIALAEKGLPFELLTEVSWLARQRRKIEGGLAEMARLVGLRQ